MIVVVHQCHTCQTGSYGPEMDHMIFILFLGYVVTSEDVNFLMANLHKYAYKWRDIGSSLNFHPGELENISQSFPKATTQQLVTELLSQWSQWPTSDHSDAPTMERL